MALIISLLSKPSETGSGTMNFEELPYDQHIIFLTQADVAPTEVRLLSANEMCEACYAFLSGISGRVKNRWLPSRECRSELARRLLTNCPGDWTEPGLRRELIQRVTQNIVRSVNFYQVSELDHWETQEELETDIRNAIEGTRKTIELFSRGDSKYLPMKTSLFAVSGKTNEFLASLLLGEVKPVWMTSVNSDRTPGVNDGMYPKYPPRKF
ncbi:hypothetical protein [Morganella morganii]|uniref:hypothetical protein n=2 Tax=Morganella morganii TaxID=582 RepID=UPI0037834D2A